MSMDIICFKEGNSFQFSKRKTVTFEEWITSEDICVLYGYLKLLYTCNFSSLAYHKTLFFHFRSCFDKYIQPMANINFSIWTFWISVLLVFHVHTSDGSYPELKVNEVLVNLAYDSTTNKIFIGGENVLLKASETFGNPKKITTGPKIDYINCIIDTDCVGQETNNRNKVLLIDNKNRLLITCGSLKHGVCQTRSLDDLAIRTDSNKYVVSNARLPAVALITPWGNTPGTYAMYVATTWDRKYQSSDLNFGIRPAVSTRIINSDDFSDIFAFAEDSLKFSYLQFSDFTYETKYIYGFSSGGFSYFVSVQETTNSYESKKTPKILKTFIVRLCQKDTAYLSYIELPLECQGSNGTDFNIAQSAYLTKAGEGFGPHSSHDVLVITFFESSKGWDGPSQNSAVCMYPVKEINKAMMDNLRDCVNHVNPDERFGLPWVLSGDKKCKDQVNV